ncbi:hypothetical protein FM121_09350 [Vagococcus fluvialis bH819]|uniref:Uncharacterized protein n=1 Tax=Vagococcus fluvialis bH819 TaxID=1255619 RepID=A0A1X6WPM0_9ENTE|nr:hypothetical protein FM121_09350 [Vagococcus fluvialis bH819]
MFGIKAPPRTRFNFFSSSRVSKSFLIVSSVTPSIKLRSVTFTLPVFSNKLSIAFNLSYFIIIFFPYLKGFRYSYLNKYK